MAMTTCLCSGVYQDERDGLTTAQIDTILHSGRRWDLSSATKSGGAVVFPHTYILECGAYIAACVHAALDSGADHVLALGVLHSFPDALFRARNQEKQGADVSGSVLRKVHGPHAVCGNYWKNEYSLLSFIFLWNEEIKRRGVRAPKLSIRFPYLVDKNPATLPGIKELESIARDACIVATADFCHHGVAYNTENPYELNDGIEFAKGCIEDHLTILGTGDYGRYYQHCLDIRSDSFDVGPVLHHLVGSFSPDVLDMVLVDTAPLYEGFVSPSWVAASLVKLDKI